MRIELKRWNTWLKGRVRRAFFGIIVGVAFTVFELVIDSEGINREMAVVFGLLTIALGAWLLYQSTSPNRLTCMEVVKGDMTFDELKGRVEAEEFVEPLCFWNFSKGEKSGYRLLVSDNWLLLGATMDGLVCIPKERVAKVVDACLPRKTGDGVEQEAHFIDIFLNDGKEFLPGIAIQESSTSVCDILRECFPNAEINASPSCKEDFTLTGGRNHGIV